MAVATVDLAAVAVARIPEGRSGLTAQTKMLPQPVAFRAFLLHPPLFRARAVEGRDSPLDRRVGRHASAVRAKAVSDGSFIITRCKI